MGRKRAVACPTLPYPTCSRVRARPLFGASGFTSILMEGQGWMV